MSALPSQYFSLFRRYQIYANKCSLFTELCDNLDTSLHFYTPLCYKAGILPYTLVRSAILKNDYDDDDNDDDVDDNNNNNNNNNNNCCCCCCCPGLYSDIMNYGLTFLFSSGDSKVSMEEFQNLMDEMSKLDQRE